MVHVIPRSEWGARHEDGGGSAPVPFTEWWLHHSVTIAPDLIPPFDDEYLAMRTLEDIGEQRFGRGISYTWPIMPNGRVYQGHSVDTLGAHTGGRNSFARAICLVGNYDARPVTSQQIESAAQLMVQEYRAGRAKRYTLNGGHQQLKATACPGRNGMTAISLINARAQALMSGATEEDDMAGRGEDIADILWEGNDRGTPKSETLFQKERRIEGVLYRGIPASEEDGDGTPVEKTVYQRLVRVEEKQDEILALLKSQRPST